MAKLACTFITYHKLRWVPAGCFPPHLVEQGMHVERAAPPVRVPVLCCCRDSACLSWAMVLPSQGDACNRTHTQSFCLHHRLAHGAVVMSPGG